MLPGLGLHQNLIVILYPDIRCRLVKAWLSGRIDNERFLALGMLSPLSAPIMSPSRHPIYACKGPIKKCLSGCTEVCNLAGCAQPDATSKVPHEYNRHRFIKTLSFLSFVSLGGEFLVFFKSTHTLVRKIQFLRNLLTSNKVFLDGLRNSSVRPV